MDIIRSFQEVVRTSPNNIALIYEDQQYSYAELDMLSDKVASFLQAKDTKGKQVGVAMQRCPEWIIAMLGIWKAGAVYVPLDLGNPSQRLEHIITDCKIALVLETNASGFNPSHVPSYIVNEKMGDGTDFTYEGIDEDALAVILYTSGTSGIPKGIPVRHHQAVAMSRWANERHFYTSEGDRMLQMGGLNFGASLVETLGNLLYGACLVMATEEEKHDPHRLQALLMKEKVVSAVIPPALLAIMPKVNLPYLRNLIVSGEGVSADAKDFWMKGRRMINAYGFTENVILVTSGIYEKDTPVNDIGTAMPDTVMYVVDESLSPVPDGTPGELCISGERLALGYWERPELTSVKFIDNPFYAEGERNKGETRLLYRSGDKVIRLSNGHYLYLGRIDNQIKIRGMRVEPGEIEQCLNTYPGISASVVLLKEHNNKQILVAYLQTDHEVDRRNISAFVAERLPDYMRPTMFVTMKSFPMTLNRKTDKGRLPEPDWNAPQTNYEEPLSATEKEIAQVWSEILKTPRIGRQDNFIALGGDSISAMLMVEELGKIYGIELKVQDLLTHDNLSSLAFRIDQIIAGNCHPHASGAKTFLKSKGQGLTENDTLDFIPLPPSQFSLWLECMKSDVLKDVYNMPCIFECPDSMNLSTFEKAFNQLIKAQNSFRIVFAINENNMPYIQVKEYKPMPIVLHDIEEEELAGYLYNDANVSFDLSQGPLFRCVMYRVGKQKYVCSLIMHHLISDGWSAQLIQSILLKAIADEPIVWQNLSSSYIQYAQDAYRFAQTEEYARRLDYWKGYVQEVSELQLPMLNRDSNPEFSGGTYTRGIPQELTEKIQAFCRNHSLTPFLFYCSVYLLVLARISKQADFGIAFPFWGREQNAYRQTIGYFVNILFLRYKKEYESLTFLRYLKELSHCLMELENNAVSFDKISGSVSKDATIHLAKAAFTFDKKALFHDYSLHKNVAFAIMLNILSGDDNEYFCRVEYRYSNFTEEHIERIVDMYLSTLNAVTDNPNKSVNAYSLASTDYIQSMIQSNSLHGNKEHPLPFMERFITATQEHPQQVAIVCGDESITYKELDEKSDQIASAIKAAGTPASSKIGISMQASIECIVAMVGVLKAGCCYVPMAVDLPDERKDFILQDAHCRMLFDDANYPAGCSLNCPDNNEESSSLSPNAYIIYTSGTTGKPKGVPITHLSLSYLIAAEIQKFCLSAESRGLLFASISFDASVFEIFPVLSAGGTLVIALPEERKDPILLTDLLEKQAVTFATIPPAILPVMPRRALPALSVIVLGGETTALSAIRYWYKGRTLINAYGPTENTVATTMCVVDDDFEANDIGTPLPGVSCYVLDEHLNMLPDGMIGELYIGGLQLTKGYLNRPQLNQEKFIENPYVTDEDKAKGMNTILYKSGDLVRRRPDGHLIFMGRADNQVKLRGFRIELSEIEVLLQQCKGVRNALVQIRKTNMQDELAAFIQPDAAGQIRLADLQKELRSKLPAYMIPGKWAIIDEFPLTVNGKINYRLLPEPNLMISTDDIVLAETEAEKQLLSEAQAILGTNLIGVETDLLDAGMTSMQILEFVGHVVENTDLRITISSVYKERTIRKITQHTKSKLYYWINENDGSKPVLVFLAGFHDVTPFYDYFLHYLAQDFSVFVIESYYDFFVRKSQVSLNLLFKAYETIISELGCPIDVLTGFCSGAEMAIAFALYMQQKHPDSMPFKILNMEALYKRSTTDRMALPIDKGTSLGNRIKIMNELYKDFPSLDYNGWMVNVFAGNYTPIIHPEIGEIADPGIQEQLKQAWMVNRQAWQKHYPQAPYYELDGDHWTFFEGKNIRTLREIIKKHWNL